MTDRERLIELLDKSFEYQYENNLVISAEQTADFLLSNGWRRLPCKVGVLIGKTAVKV